MLAFVGLAVNGPTLRGGAASTVATGVFHTVCAYSHSLHDDPIVFPTTPGISHMHDFFGNTSTNANSTLTSLQNATSNCTVHAPDTDADHSGYWVPQLLFNGTPTPILQAQAYYDSNIGTVQTPPTGLEIIGGNAHATTPPSTNIVKWTCSGTTGNTIGAQTAPPTCPTGSLLKVVVQTPNCLADTQFNNPGSINDTPYTTYAFQNGGHCPTGYQPLPSVRIEVKYPPGIDGRGTITLASGPTYTMHADWFNAWDHNTLNAFVQHCINTNTDCGNTAPAFSVTASAPTTVAARNPTSTSTTSTSMPASNGPVAISDTPCTVLVAGKQQTGSCTGTFAPAPSP